MDCLYMNNYRGFTKTILPLKQVNFLVGENSTGKTSVLALLELLSKPEFWFTFDFNIGNYEFGGYKDIVSSTTNDPKEYQIGLCKYNHKKKENDVFYLLHFRMNLDGLPKLARFSYLCREYVLTAKFSDKQFALLVKTDLPKSVDCSQPSDCFEYMKELAATQRAGYKIYKDLEKDFTTYFFYRIPIFLSDFFSDKQMKERIGDMLPYSRFPGLSRSFNSMAPIRTTPKRTYDGYTKPFSPEGEHTPYVIRKELSVSIKQKNEFKKALEVFGKDSGLFKSVGVSQFGNDSAAPFELIIVLSDKPLRINSVGYGVSQVLPVVVQLLTNEKRSWLAIQQPEVHLHPKAQAALGDVMFHSALQESQTLFVETHSDYLIDRFRLNMRNQELPSDFAQLVFFERTKVSNIIHPMVIEDSGEYPEDQPAEFRNFFLEEHKRILGV